MIISAVDRRVEILTWLISEIKKSAPNIGKGCELSELKKTVFYQQNKADIRQLLAEMTSTGCIVIDKVNSTTIYPRRAFYKL
jgi:hypothetical protein